MGTAAIYILKFPEHAVDGCSSQVVNQSHPSVRNSAGAALSLVNERIVSVDSSADTVVTPPQPQDLVALHDFSPWI